MSSVKSYSYLGMSLSIENATPLSEPTSKHGKASRSGRAEAAPGHVMETRKEGAEKKT